MLNIRNNLRKEQRKEGREGGKGGGRKKGEGREGEEGLIDYSTGKDVCG